MSSSYTKATNLSTKSMSNNQTVSGSIQSAGSSSGAIDNNNYRRNGGGGAAAAARFSQPNARGQQSIKKNHVDRRKPTVRDYECQEQMAHLDAEIERAQAGNSRRGTSITHLMNWDVSRRPFEHHYRPRNTYQRRNPTWGLGSGYHAVDKARYVNANYRFIVDPVGDYQALSVDSDVTVPWNKVLQVLASAKSQIASCPICLCVPVAPRMAKCGHIFCLPCLMRYMASAEEAKQQAPVPEKKPRYKKCPICWDSVYMSDVRPVRWFTGQEGEVLQDGMDVVLRLMRRRHGTTLALPRDGAEIPEETDGIPWNFAAEVADYARVMKGTKSYMEDQFNQEVQDLKIMGREDELMFNEEGEWTRKAIAAVKELIEGLNIKDMEPIPAPVVDELKTAQPKIACNHNIEDIPDMYLVNHTAKSGQITRAMRPDTETYTKEELPQDPPAPAPRIIDDHRIRPDGDSAYFFYRALPQYYLSPLDIRILKTAFGSYETFPATILPRVDFVSTGHIVDDEFRRRTRYLAHLPYGTEVAFLECDWTDVVPPEVLNKFKVDIDKRKKRRRDKEIQEEKDRQRAEKEEREGRWPQQQHRDEPATTVRGRFSDDDFVALAIGQSQNTENSPPPISTPPAGVEASIAAIQTPGMFPTSTRTVWGTPAVARSNATYLKQAPTRDHHDDGWAEAWERDYLLEEDLLAHHHLDDGLAKTPGKNPMGGGKGRGKKKKVVLMNNGGKRGA
ncbi:hypothetical protein EV426DRAFT_592218 [Tirmania nivea]|nr:hypothetical protein EV426DRAFT_592218 [Tirmania nivea]